MEIAKTSNPTITPSKGDANLIFPIIQSPTYVPMRAATKLIRTFCNEIEKNGWILIAGKNSKKEPPNLQPTEKVTLTAAPTRAPTNKYRNETISLSQL